MMLAVIIGLAVVMMLLSPFALMSAAIGWLFIVLPVTGGVGWLVWHSSGAFGGIMFGGIALFISAALVGGMQQLKSDWRAGRL